MVPIPGATVPARGSADPDTGGYPALPDTGGYPALRDADTGGYPALRDPDPPGYRPRRDADVTASGDRGGAVAPSRRRWPGGDGYGGDAYGDDTYGDDYDDYDDAELDELPKRRGCRRAVAVLAVLVVLAIVAGWFGWSWVQGKIDPSGPPGETVLVEIPEGTSTAGVGDVLADAGVISDATVWDWYTKLRDVGTIKAGSYEMRLDSSFDEAIDDLKAEPLPPEVEAFVTVPPGLTQAQIAARLADPEDGAPGFTPEAVQAALADPASRSAFLPADQPSLEGTLYPETYAFEEGDTPATCVQRMVQEFDDVATELDLNGRAAALGISPYEALIVASMVEREAGTVADGPRVARVIYNRMAAGEPLGIDATSCYEKGEIPCELTTAELEDNSAVRHPGPARPPADADRLPGPRQHRGGAEPGRGRLALVRPRRRGRRRVELLHQRLRGVPGRQGTVRRGWAVRLIGPPCPTAAHGGHPGGRR